ncbi:MAG: hypothetical protein RLZZ398_536 [Verrucomicrobiota bacterium]|jgi:hypothetical protein
MIETLREICGKLWNVGKLAVPGVALFSFIEWLFSALIEFVKNYVGSQIDLVWGKVLAQMEVLRVDLVPSGEFAGFIAKANVIVPLDEMWRFFLLYLGVASVVLGVKWARNLIPGLV